MSLRLKDRVALVTGAGRGIGKAVAQAFAAEGAVMAVNDLNADTAKATAEATGGAAFPADITDKRAVEQMVAAVVERFGRLDVLVANAGVIHVNRVVDVTEEQWDQTFAVNAKGVFLCCQAAARVMLKQKHGRILATASSASKTSEPYIAPYCASKFAVFGFIQALALELAPHHINVNCVCPVNVETDMVDLLAREYAPLNGRTPEEQFRHFHEEIPWGRMARPMDVARVFVFLASDEAEYLTGQGINVSGGLEVH